MESQTGDWSVTTRLSAGENSLRAVPRWQRCSLNAEELLTLQTTGATLRPVLRQVLRQTKSLTELPWLHQPEFGILADIGERALELTRRVYQELQRIEAGTAVEYCAADTLTRGLEHAGDCLDQIERQMALLSRASHDAGLLLQEMKVLVEQSGTTWVGVPYSSLQALARRVLSGCLGDIDSGLINPQLLRTVLSQRFNSPVLGAVLSRAVSTAPQVARIARSSWLHVEQVELVTAATLMQDCGFYLLSVARLGNSLGLEPESLLDQPQHSAIGAGLLGNYAQAPVGLTRIVAQHHERLNSRGTPRGLQGSDICHLGRLVGVVTRFDELREAWSTSQDLLQPPEQADSAAIEQLLVETLAGDWDEQFVEKLLANRDPQMLEHLSERARQSYAFGREYAETLRSPGALPRLDPAQPLAGTHLAAASVARSLAAHRATSQN